MANEIVSPIPARLKNVAKGGHVAGASDIVDDALNKEQSVVNAERIADVARIEDEIDVVEQKVDDIGDAIQFDQDGDLVTVDGDDFQDPEARGKIPTIGAILDGRDDGVYDVTAHNDNAKFASLEALLSDENLNTLIPTAVRKGGMSIRFVQSSDNKYVQYRLMKNTFSTTLTDWQGIDDTPTAGSDNLVKSGGVQENSLLLSSQIGDGFRGKKKDIVVTSIRTTGKAIDINGHVVDYGDCSIYGPINLQKGDCVEFIATIEREVAILSLIVGGVYKPQIIDNNSEDKTYTYRATEECQVELCTKTSNIQGGYIHIYHPIDKSFLLHSQGNDIDFTTSGYIDDSGVLVNSSTYYITDPIQLRKGDILKVNVKCSGLNYLCGYNNGLYTLKLRGTFDVTDDNFYVCEDDEQVVIGGLKSSGGSYQIFGSNEYVMKNDLDSAMSTVDDKIAAVDTFTIEAEDNIVVGTEKAYIDKDTGLPVSYNSYNISSPIQVKEGDVISAHFKCIGAAAIAKYNEGEAYDVLVLGNGEADYEYVAQEDCEVVLSGDKDWLNNGTEYTIVSKHSVKNTVKEIITGGMGSFSLINPYAGANFDNQVPSNSHEHCYDKGKLESAYNRGIRCIACSHYIPSTPRYPFSSFNTPYQDYKSKQAYLDNDRELVTRYTTGSIPTLNIGGDTIYTDDIPQIANAERAFVKDIPYTHMNILGLLWGSAGNALCNGELTNSDEDKAIKLEGSLESTTKFNQLLEDVSMWQFGPQYAFGTINHCNDLSKATYAFEHCPQIFKAMELFNQGYSDGWNQDFKDTYDALLKSGKRIWGTAVVDWQGDWATWNYTTAEEKVEWAQKFAALSQAEQEEYGTAENYYMETGRYKFDRGCNVMLMDNAYNSKTAGNKAKDIINAYIAGRYYMSGLNTRSMKLYTDNHLVTFMLSDIATKVKVITANGFTEHTNVNNVQYVAQSSDKFIRFEAYFGDGDFVYSNPVWVEL